MKIVIGILISFLGTTLGSLMVFFLKNNINEKIQKLLLGFASGVMIAASFFSLLLPSLQMANSLGKLSFLPAGIGFLLGMLFLLFLDSLIPHLHINSNEPEGIKSKMKKKTMMFLAITIHNIPEGMAVGVIFASVLANNEAISMLAAFSLSIGIAIQNFPEGAIVSLPLAVEGNSKRKAFGLGVLSGVVEPIAAVITILLSNVLISLMPYLLSFAAGAMIYVVVEELIPESQSGKHSNIATIGVAIGFVLMMVLDVVFS